MSPGLVLPIIPGPIVPPSRPRSDSKISRTTYASPPRVPTTPTPIAASAARRVNFAIPDHLRCYSPWAPDRARGTASNADHGQETLAETHHEPDCANRTEQ